MSKAETLDDLRKRVAELEDAVACSRQNAGAIEGELRKFRLLYDLATAMTGERTLDENLQLIVDTCCSFLHSDVAYIAILDGPQGELRKRSTSGIRSEHFRTSRLSGCVGLGGLVIRTRKGHIVADYHAESGIEGPIEQSAFEEGLVSGMAAPIRMHDRDIGVICVFTRSCRSFTTSELDTLTLIGNLAAMEISRREVEERLRESDERFRFMAETTGDVIYRLRYDSMHYDYLSPGIQRLTGYTQDEIHLIGFANLVYRIDFPGEENVVPDSIIENRREGRTGEFRADYLIQTRSGEARWLRDHSFPWIDTSGRNVGSVGILSDVTEYKRAEALVRERTADLIESEEKYRTLVENVPLVVYRMRPNGELLFVNQFVEEVFGYSPLDILSDSALWTEVVYQEDRDRIQELRSVSIRGSKELVAEYRVVHKEGRIVHVIDHAIPFQSPEGAVSSLDGIIIDITGRIRLQEQIIRSEGLKTVGAVSARLAHEIRNPLVSAGGFARRLLSSMNPDDPNRSKVEIILKEVGRLESILRTIVNYIQPLELDLAPHDLNIALLSVLNELQTRIEKRPAQFQLRLSSELRAVHFDLKQIRRVIETLILNALHQMPAGALLHLETSQTPETVALTMVYPVSHLSTDDAEHFFYPFTTFHGLCEAVDLPLCRVIVNKHQGTIEAQMIEPKIVSIHMALPR